MSLKKSPFYLFANFSKAINFEKVSIIYILEDNSLKLIVRESIRVFEFLRKSRNYTFKNCQANYTIAKNHSEFRLK